jgi:hypothetical protein
MSVAESNMVKVLRPYQARIIKNVMRDPGHLLVEQPTGSGKTLQIVALARILLGTRFNRVLIAAPQRQIEEGFTGGEEGLRYDRVQYPDSSSTIQIPPGFIEASREVSYGSRGRILSYLALPQSHALACTHAALSTLDMSVLPTDCSSILMVVDEAHHAPAEGLGAFIDEFERRGGTLHFYTATPWRADDKPVVRPEMRVIRRSLAQHMAEGWAPPHLAHELVVVGAPGAKVSAPEFYGEAPLPRSFEQDLVDKLVAKWRADSEPKAIIRVPPVRGGAHGLVRRIAEAFGAIGAHVLDASGVGNERQRLFLSELESERALPFGKSRWDVIVGIQRVHEGTDWPQCSAVYSVGMPSNLAFTTQLAGRGLRKKGEDCPKRHRNTTRLAFFVPGGGSLEKLGLEHSKHALLTACFLANYQVAQEWLLVGEIGVGVGSLLGSEGEARDRLASLLSGGPRGAEAVAYLEWAKRQLRLNGVSRPSQEEILEMAAGLTRQTGLDLTEGDLVRAAVALQVTRRGDGGERARAAVRRAAQQAAPDWERALAVEEDNRLQGVLSDLFDRLRAEFREETLDHSLVLDLVGQQLHNLTGGKMTELMERMRLAHPVLTHGMIGHWARRERFNPVLEFAQPPGKRGRPIAGTTFHWHQIRRALFEGEYGLPGGEHLYQAAAKHGHETDWSEVLRTASDRSNFHWLIGEQQAKDWVAEYLKQHGKLPEPTEERVADTNITWQELNQGTNYMGGAVSRWYGFKWIEDYIRTTGQQPRPSERLIPGTQTTWSELHNLIQQYGKHEKGLADVAQHVLKSRPELAKQHNLGFSKADLKAAAEDPNGFLRLRVWVKPDAEGRFPQPTDERVPGTEVTWAELEAAGRQTLARFYQDDLAGRNGSVPAGCGLIDLYFRLKPEWGNNLDLVKNFVASTGRLPREDGENVPGHRGLTWADVYASFRRCGFPHYSLMHSWLVDRLHFWVSCWVKTYGSAPDRDSGPIPESGRLTWQDVDDLIRQMHYQAFPYGVPEDRSQININRLTYVASCLSERIAEYKVVQGLKQAGGGR